jgi:hypothetical protein
MKQSDLKSSCRIGFSKKIAAFIFLYLMILIGNGSSQIFINNPGEPKTNKAARTVLLEEVMRIRDDGKNSIFKNPHYLSLLEDGSLIFFDYPNIYKYSQNGKFIFKALKQGNGPGECHHPNSYFVKGDRIRVYSWVPPKVMDYDLNGQFLKEMKTDYHGPFSFLGLIDGKIFGIRDEIRFSEDIHKEGFIETPFRLYEISQDFKNLKKIYDIPMKHYIKKAHWWRRGIFDTAVYRHFLFFIHTAEYKIVKFDVRSGRVERIFKRQYARRKIQKNESEQDIYERVPKQNLPPPLDYDFDIIAIQVFRDLLYVKTSTKKINGTKWLIDVFDMEGKYVDCFYMQFPLNNENHWIANSIIIPNDCVIFIPEQNKNDGLVSIGKYRIKDNFYP